MTDHCSDCALEMTNDCPRYGGKSDCDHAEEARKGTEYDMHSDSCYTIPECPECGMPLPIVAKDIGRAVECFCGEMVRIPDTEWTRKYVEENTGEKEEETTCMACNGTMKISKYKRLGKWVTAGGKCEDCGMYFVV